MTITPDLSSIIADAATQRKLQPRNDLDEVGWTFWELRTLNIHRVVGSLREHRPFADAHDLEGEIRSAVARNFKRSWWRGMAYGVVAEAAATSLSPDDLKLLVDIRENADGTLQWVILVADNSRAAVGVHMWMEGYLSPVYRSILQALTGLGYHVATTIQGKDGLMKSLTAGADLKVALDSFGAQRIAFPEFRDHL